MGGVLKRVAVIVIVTLIYLPGAAWGQEVEYVNATLFEDGIKDTQTNGNYSYAITRHTFQVFYLADEESPELISGIPLPGNLKKLITSNGYAYIANYDFGLQIIDISDHENPRLVNTFGVDSPVTIDVDNQYAYLGKNNFILLDIINIEDPLNPVRAGQYYDIDRSTKVKDISVNGGYAFFADSLNGLYIVNVNDPSAPYFEGTINTEYGATDIFIDSEYAYIISYAGWANSAFEIFDIGDPANPELTGNLLSGLSSYTDIWVLDDYAYITNSWEMFSMAIYDVSDPYNPTYVTSFDNWGWGAMSISISGHIAFLGSYRPFSLTCVNISNPEIPQNRGHYAAIGNTKDVFIRDSIAFVAAGDRSLVAIDLSDPATPEIIGDCNAYGSIIKVFVEGNFAFSVNSYYGMQIFDVSNPDDIQEISRYLSSVTKSVCIDNDYAYLVNYDSGLQIIDVYDPANPVLIGSYDQYATNYYDVIVRNNYAYLSCGFNIGFRIVDVSDPADPFLVGSYDVPGSVRAIDVSGDIACAAAGQAGLLVMDIAQPNTPVLISQYDTDGFAIDIVVSGNYAYMADTLFGLYVFDFSDPESPVLVDGYDTPGSIKNIFVDGEYIYVADKYSLLILRFDPETGIIEEISNLPQTFALAPAYPNPFNASTTIQYDLPTQSEVVIEIYDLLGRKIETLAAGLQPAGSHSIIWDAEGVSSGLYFYRIEAGNYEETRKCVLLK